MDRLEHRLKLAAELQARAELDAGDEAQLRQFDQIASDVGIAPEFMRQAAALLGGGRRQIDSVGGIATSIVLTREFACDHSSIDRDGLIDSIRLITLLFGELDVVDRTTTWRAQEAYRTLRVTIVGLTDRVRLRVERDSAPLVTAVLLGGAAGGGSIVATVAGLVTWRFAGHSVPLAISAATAAWMGAYLVTRALLHRIIDRDAIVVQRLFTDLSVRLSQLRSRSQSLPSSASGTQTHD